MEVSILSRLGVKADNKPKNVIEVVKSIWGQKDQVNIHGLVDNHV